MSEFTLSDGTPHREPVLAAIQCPPDRMPLNCTRAAKAATSNGWVWEATYAIGYSLGHVEDGEEVHSVVFRARRGPRRLAASWHSEKRGAEKMGFAGAWLKTPGAVPEPLGSKEMFEHLTEPSRTL